MWTKFMDMHSGGSAKENWNQIYIEAPEAEAQIIFYNRFGHNPERVTCTCCGEDYSITEHQTLEQATAFERNCRFDETKKEYVEEPETEKNYKIYQTLKEYKKNESVLIIYKDEIKDEEKIGTIPTEGYIWV